MSTEPLRRDWGGILAALIFVLLGVWVLSETGEMTPLGAVFPRAIAGAMIVFASLAAVLRLVRATRPAGAPVLPQSPARRLGFVAVMAAWVLLMPVVGFFTTSLAAFMALMLVANHDPWTPRRAVILVTAGVIVVVAFQALFTEALNVPLPAGLLY